MQSDVQMKAFMVRLLKDKLPSTYYYHDVEHTLYVVEKTIEIARHENCTEKETTLLYAAALWHDVGYINTYAGHETESCKLVQQYLPGYGFSSDDISSICGMIMATKIPQSPQNKSEAIIADADLEYLGTEHAAIMADNLFRELSSLNPGLTEAQWNRQQINFLKDHQYFTGFCKEKREPVKAAYLKELENKI